MTTIAKINEQGMFADIEQRAEFLSSLSMLKGFDVRIDVVEMKHFDYAFIESANLQERFNLLINKETPDFTNQDITILRGKMSACCSVMNEWLAKAKTNENNIGGRLKIYEAIEKVNFVNNGDKPAVASLKSKTTSKYRELLDEFNGCYEFRVLVEAHVKSLTDTMNAISSISRGGEITQFNPNRQNYKQP